MNDISTYLQQIMQARYGEEVRGAIHDAIEECYDDVSTAKTRAEDAVNAAETATTDAQNAASMATSAAAAAEDAIDDLETVVASKAVRYDSAQSSLTDGQKEQARNNIEAASADDVNDLKSALSNIEPGLSAEAKVALMGLLRCLSAFDSDAQTYYEDLYNALYPDLYPKITAVYSPGSHVVWDTDSLDSLKPYLTVVYFETEGSEGTVVSNYTLTGSLTTDESTVHVEYNNLSSFFTVQVSTHTIYALPANYEFDGTANDVVFTGVKLIDTNKTYSMVFKGTIIFPEGSTVTQIVAQIRDQSNATAFVCGLYPSNNRFSVGAWGKPTYYENPSAFAAGEHTFKVAVSHTAGASVQLYALTFDDNAPTHTDNTYNYASGEHPLVIGAGYNGDVDPYASSQRMTGVLEEFKVLDYAMTQTELDAYVA